MKKRFEVIRPKSLLDANYEAFEILIRWIGLDGSEYYYMFYDAEINHSVRSDVINEKDIANFQAIISSVDRSYTLVANDISKNDFEVFLQMVKSKYVWRVFKNSTLERFVPNPSSFKYKLQDGRYDFALTLIQTNETKWR